MIIRVLTALCLGVVLSLATNLTQVSAQALVSPSFQMREHSVGNSGLHDSQSNSFRVNLSVGDTAVSNFNSENFQSDAGSITTNDPTLTFSIDSYDVDFGSLSAGGTSTGYSTFTVANYTSYGYVVYISGTSPKNEQHTVAPMEETGASTPGQSQFGINLVANTEPTSLGANPDHKEFGSGNATANYATSNQYRFVSGEAIAESGQSSGETTYTISYIVNMEGLAPGGRYSSDLTLICVGTF